MKPFLMFSQVVGTHNSLKSFVGIGIVVSPDMMVENKEDKNLWQNTARTAS